jgi:pantothenate kinase
VSNRVLVERLLALSEESPQNRILLGIAGSPGGGKTTLAESLVAEVNSLLPSSAVHLPMDGFHLANSTLDRLGMHDKKGAIETFDGWGFLALLDRVRAETTHTVYAPSFHRRVDEGVAGEIAIEPHHTIVVVEGNYVLAEAGPWGAVATRFDESWFCSTPPQERLERLINRHTRHGRTPEEARNWAIEVDGVNAALIDSTSPRADVIVSGLTGEILGVRS